MDRKLPRTDGDITEEKRENLAAPGEVSNGRSRKKMQSKKKSLRPTQANTRAEQHSPRDMKGETH